MTLETYRALALALFLMIRTRDKARARARLIAKQRGYARCDKTAFGPRNCRIYRDRGGRDRG